MKTLTWVVIIILAGFGIYWLSNRDNENVVTNTYNNVDNSVSTTTINISTTGTSTNQVSSKAKTVTVTYSATGFSPSPVNINKGDTVKFVNNSDSNMWVGSANHPSHTVYDGTTLSEHCATGATPSFDSCKNLSKGQSYSFTFDKVGTWNYHNHSSSSKFGSVVVK